MWSEHVLRKSILYYWQPLQTTVNSVERLLTFSSSSLEDDDNFLRFLFFDFLPILLWTRYERADMVRSGPKTKSTIYVDHQDLL